MTTPTIDQMLSASMPSPEHRAAAIQVATHVRLHGLSNERLVNLAIEHLWSALNGVQAQLCAELCRRVHPKVCELPDGAPDPHAESMLRDIESYGEIAKLSNVELAKLVHEHCTYMDEPSAPREFALDEVCRRLDPDFDKEEAEDEHG